MRSQEAGKAVESHGRDKRGWFAPGNKCGRGGAKPGGGRPPKPKNPSLLAELYDTLDRGAPHALRRLLEFVNHEDPAIALRACETILRKVLPDQARLQATMESLSTERVTLLPIVVKALGLRVITNDEQDEVVDLGEMDRRGISASHALPLPHEVNDDREE